MKQGIISGAIIALLLACFFLYSRTESLKETVGAQKALLGKQVSEIEQLQARIQFERKIINDQATELLDYKSRVQEIKTIEKPVIVYRDIVKTEPKEVIVEAANEDTNKFYTDITTASDAFRGVHNN